MCRRTLLALITCGLMTCWTVQPVHAAGGKNQGEAGAGETSTGSDAEGQAEQDRTGRDDSSEDSPDEVLEILID